MSRFYCLFYLLTGVCALAQIKVIELDGQVDHPISSQVSRLQQVVITYNLHEEAPNLEDRTLTFDISSSEAESDQPIIATITSGGTVQQVKLPQTVTSSQATYSQTTVTLCLVNATLDLDTVVVVTVTASTSNHPMTFNLTAHVFENYTLPLGAYPAVTVAPAAPLTHRFAFPPNDGTTDMVLVHIHSPDLRCSVLSIQSDSCPVNNKEDDIKFKGTFQTFTEQAAITVHRNSFPTESFFMVITVLSSDFDCHPTLPDIAWRINREALKTTETTTLTPLVPAIRRQKTVLITLRRVATQNDILLAICVAVAILLGVALVVLVFTFTVTRKRLTSMKAKKENKSQVSPDDERTHLVRRRLDPQSSSTPSGTGLATYGSVAPEIVIRTPGDNLTAPENRTQFYSPPTRLENESSSGTQRDLSQDDISPIAQAVNDDHDDQAVDDTSSVDSSEYDKLPEVTYDKDLLRTKLHLHVSDLARKRPRELIKKYALYPWNLGIISFFYVLPVVQLVLAYQIAVNHLGDQDTCYYNFRCAIPVGGFSAFNNVFSNISYIILGILFIVIVRYHDFLLKDWEFTAGCGPYGTIRSGLRHEPPLVADATLSPVNNNHVTFLSTTALGIPPLHGISYALGIALIMEGIMSACYHVCPNSTNFQFDTTYMYIIAWLLIAKIYQMRHPDIGRNAHLFYFGVAIVIFLAMLGAVFGVDSILFYVLLIIVMIPMTIEISVYFYFMGSFKVNSSIFFRAYYAVRFMIASRSCKPSHPLRLIFIAAFNILNWGLAIFGLVAHPPDFDTFLLTISISNVMLYTAFYVIMKIRHRERIHPMTISIIIIAACFWGAAFFFFFQHQTSWQLTPAGSRTLNQPCVMFNFFDAHDVWHFLSAHALFSSFLILLVIDDEVMLLPRDKIPVF